MTITVLEPESNVHDCLHDDDAPVELVKLSFELVPSNSPQKPKETFTIALTRRKIDLYFGHDL